MASTRSTPRLFGWPTSTTDGGRPGSTRLTTATTGSSKSRSAARSRSASFWNSQTPANAVLRPSWAVVRAGSASSSSSAAQLDVLGDVLEG